MKCAESTRAEERSKNECTNGVSRVNFRKFTKNGPSTILASASLVIIVGSKL